MCAICAYPLNINNYETHNGGRAIIRRGEVGLKIDCFLHVSVLIFMKKQYHNHFELYDGLG
jgi:hypothetical protein